MKISEQDREELEDWLENVTCHVGKRSIELNGGEIYIQALIEEVDRFREMLIRFKENGHL